MALYPCRTAGGGGTRNWRLQTNVSQGIINQLNISYDNGTLAKDTTTPYTFPDGALRYTMTDSSPFRKTYTFLKDGYFNVNGTWTYKTANSTYISASFAEYIYWFEDLKQP